MLLKAVAGAMLTHFIPSVEAFMWQFLNIDLKNIVSVFVFTDNCNSDICTCFTCVYRYILL